MLTTHLLRRLLPVTLVAYALSSSPGATQGQRREADWPADTATATPSVTPTADMSIVRMAHTATALADGRVLVLGGFTSDSDAEESAESYNPATARFSPLPRMIAMRHSHTATVLSTGKVLIVGGYGAGAATLASAELFDPTTSTFTPTGSMRAARAGHVAVLLANGKVLIAGGVGPDWSFLSTAELYDPATGKFSPTNPMTVARESHVAIRLQDGRVLIAGGHRGRRADITLYASAETYDPATGIFTRVGDMHIRRHKHDGVALRDGRVLITGGSDERDSDGAYNSSELFDPRTDKFTIGPAMERPRYKHNGSSILLPNGTVLLAGGAPQAEVFNPATRQFFVVASNAHLAGQFSAAAALTDGRVLITGGYGPHLAPQRSAWLYRP